MTRTALALESPAPASAPAPPPSQSALYPPLTTPSFSLSLSPPTPSSPSAAPPTTPTASKHQKQKSAAWVRLSVLRLIGIVPWSGINIACGVTAVPIRDSALGAFIGSLPWTAVTCQVSTSLSSLFVFVFVFLFLLDWFCTRNIGDHDARRVFLAAPAQSPPLFHVAIPVVYSYFSIFVRHPFLSRAPRFPRSYSFSRGFLSFLSRGPWSIVSVLYFLLPLFFSLFFLPFFSQPPNLMLHCVVGGFYFYLRRASGDAWC